MITNQAVLLVIEIFFNAVFALEFLTKFGALRCSYFSFAWNWFDFILLGLGMVGLVADAMAVDVSSESRIFRFNRVFRVLRILRIFRLLKLYKVLLSKYSGKDISLKLAEHLQTITVSRAFVRAHVGAQEAFTKFFVGEGNAFSCEQARCIMESQTEIYRAIAMAATEANDVEATTLHGMSLLRENVRITGELSRFVLEANEAGVISSQEAECLLHPLQDNVRVFNTKMRQTQGGLVKGSGSSKGKPALFAVSAAGDTVDIEDAGFHGTIKPEEPGVDDEDEDELGSHRIRL